MDRFSRAAFSGLVALVALFLFVVPAQADDFTVSYCSSQNTADGDAQYWQWQSNGWCTNACKSDGTYAFAVIQQNDCWCSNYIPVDQSDTSDCSVDCPGFPSEKCGNKDKGLFIYIQLPNKPSGTKGTSQPTSAQVSSSSAAPPPSSTEVKPSTPSSAPPSPVSSAKETVRDTETVVQTVTAKPTVITFTPAPTPSLTPTEQSSAPPTTLKTTASSAGSSANTEPQTSFVIVTESGRVVTQTVINTPTSAPVQTEKQQKSSNTGAIVGGVVGGLAGLVAIVGGVFFLLRRRRQQQQQREDDGQSGVQRNTSTMSKAGLLRGEKEPQYPPKIATTFNSRHSRTLDNESISPVSGSDRRSSRPYIFDQRLNPSALMMNLDNNSRGSFASMDDSRDYGRTLNIRNPDPDTDRH